VSPPDGAIAPIAARRARAEDAFAVGASWILGRSLRFVASF
jgi:hypothetical protein